MVLVVVFGGRVLMGGVGGRYQCLYMIIMGYSGGPIYLCFHMRWGQVWVFVMLFEL